MDNKEKIKQNIDLTLKGIEKIGLTPILMLCRAENGDLKLINVLGAKDPLKCFEIAARNFLNQAQSFDKNKDNN